MVGWGEVEVELELEVLVWGLCRRYFHGGPSALVGYLYNGSFSLVSGREPKIASFCCLVFLLGFVSTPFAVMGFRSTAASVTNHNSYHLFSRLMASSAFLPPGFPTRYVMPSTLVLSPSMKMKSEMLAHCDSTKNVHK